jgi:hypothetical protein
MQLIHLQSNVLVEISSIIIGETDENSAQDYRWITN